MNLIPGGPASPSYEGMTAAKANGVKKRYHMDRQKFREDSRQERLRARKGSSFDENNYTGDLTPTLHPMTQVMNSCLKKGHTFPDLNIIALRIAEEANYQGICFQMDKSNKMKLYCCGPESFLVYATDSDTSAWTIARCQVLEEAGEHTVGSPHLPPDVKLKIPWSPYKEAMIVPLIAKTIAEMPMASN